jgi:F-type H+-transporting ATPase subunit b
MDIQLTQILFQIINFSVVVGALTYFLYKPVLKIFDERSKRIAEGQKAAQEAIKTQEELEAVKKKSQNDLKKERAEVLRQAQEEAKTKAQEIIAKAKAEAKVEREKSLVNWEKEKTQLYKDSKQEMADAVIAVSAKVISKSLDNKAHQQLIDKELDNILKSI